MTPVKAPSTQHRTGMNQRQDSFLLPALYMNPTTWCALLLPTGLPSRGFVNLSPAEADSHFDDYQSYLGAVQGVFSKEDS